MKNKHLLTITLFSDKKKPETSITTKDLSRNTRVPILSTELWVLKKKYTHRWLAFEVKPEDILKR